MRFERACGRMESMKIVRFHLATAPVALVTLGVVAWLALAGGVGGADAAPAAKPATPPQGAKAAKPAKKPAEPEFKLVLEPRAMELLKATSARLAAAKSMSFTATVSYEYPSKLGPPIAYTMRYDVTMQRPDKLKVVMPGDGPASEFYYDGKAMMAYAPAENLVAVADAPADDRRGAEGGVRHGGDLLSVRRSARRPIPMPRLTDGAILAFYIGPSGVVGGTKTDMVAWANNDVFLQIWIGVDDKLPRRFRAIYPHGSVGAAPRDGAVELAARRADRAGRVRVAEGASGQAHRVREPCRRAAAGRQANGQGEAGQGAPPESTEVAMTR